jgi:hypothetical protein
MKQKSINQRQQLILGSRKRSFKEKEKVNENKQ